MVSMCSVGIMADQNKKRLQHTLLNVNNRKSIDHNVNRKNDLTDYFMESWMDKSGVNT